VGAEAGAVEAQGVEGQAAVQEAAQALGAQEGAA
jgi:hypothetical protein